MFMRRPRRTLLYPRSSRPVGSPAGTIGQSIGKLPTKHTTEHVAKTPIPEGGLNAKGQMKVTDSTGVVRFIDMKQARVRGPSGVPVKPPSRGSSDGP